MEIPTSLAMLLSFLIPALLKGITGLGFSALCLPILTLFMEASLSIPVVILPSLTSNLVVMAQA